MIEWYQKVVSRIKRYHHRPADMQVAFHGGVRIGREQKTPQALG